MEFTGYLEGLFFQRIGLAHWWQNSKTQNSTMASTPSERIGLETFTYIFIYKKVYRNALVGSFKKYLSEVKFSVQQSVEYHN